MMIPPIAAATAPAREAGSLPADGFEQAMAAALGIVPPQAQAALAAANDAAAAVASASTVHALLATAPPSDLVDGAHGRSASTQPLTGIPAGAIATGGSGAAAGSASTVGTGKVEPMQAAVTHDNDQPVPATPTGVPEGAGTAEPVSGMESTARQMVASGTRDGQELTRVAEVAAASSVIATAKRATAVSQGPDHAAIAAQGLGLRSLRGAAPTAAPAAGADTAAIAGTAAGTDTAATAETAAGTDTAATAETAAGTDSEAIARALDPLHRSVDPRADTPPALEASTADVPGTAITATDRPIDHLRAMPEQAGPGADAATQARMLVGTERPDRPPASGRRSARPELPTLDPITRGGDQVAAPSAPPGAAVDTGTHVPSGMLQRVEDAIRRLENAPPPRSITLTIDDQGLTRVTVSMLSDGFRVTVPEGAQTPTGLVQDLEQALSNRGFELSQNGEQRHRPRPDHDDAPAGTPTAAPRRATADTGIRL